MVDLYPDWENLRTLWHSARTAIARRKASYEHRTPAEQRRVLSGDGVPQLFIDVLVGLDHIFASSAQSETTMTVAEVLGCPPRSVPDWITDNIHLFR